MKKTSQGNSTRPGVRSAYTGSSSSYRTSATPAPQRVSSPKRVGSRKPAKKKSPAGAIAIITSIAVIGGGAYFFTSTPLGKSIINNVFQIEKKYELTNADGTVVEMTESELRELLSSDKFPQGIVVDGTDVGGKTVNEASSLLKASAPTAPITTNITLNLDNEIIPLDLSALNFESNLDEILTNAFNEYALKGDEDINGLIANYNARENLKKANAVYTSAYTLKTEGISEIVHGTLDEKSTEAADAIITGFDAGTCEFQYTPSSKGYVIDIDAAVNDVKTMLDAGTYEGQVVVSAEVTEPELTTEMIQNEFGLIASASSQTTANANRNHNITITCEKINGMVLQPGESFDFNGFIGQRTPDKGYKLAGTIQDGQLKDDYGGGICQVTSMMYQSVIKSDLTVIERNPHMWPSSYATAGTDAAVDWPGQTFSFTNSSPYPIAISIYWNPENAMLTSAIYGHKLPDGQSIGFEGAIVSRSSATTEYIADSSMATGTRESVRGAHDGCTATSYKIWYDANGNEIKREELKLTVYSPVNAQIKVGIRNADGSLAKMNKDGTIENGNPTTPPPSETTPVAPTDPVPTDPAPTDPPAPVDPPPEAPVEG
ncbi:MAG: VanW family protein [Saccharofermentans sp.]|nr:VanW family protein [Saccharofermentans sp.]